MTSHSMGAALIAILAALQLYLSARFRRLVTPAPAAATPVGVALVITAATRLGRIPLGRGDPERGPGAQVDHIAVAQGDGFARGDLIAVDQGAVR
jgi:hypothetical protein